MRVSIITVVRNDSAGLARTIASVRSQSYRPIEFIVMDGASEDETVKVIEANEDIIGHWESQRDGGIYDAMNKGLQRATGDFLLFLNAGDELLASDSLERAASAAKQRPHADVLYFQALGEDGRPVGGCRRTSAILFDSVGNHQAALMRATVHKRFPFNTHYRIKADRDVQLRMYLAGCRMLHVPWPIARTEGGGISATAIPQKEWENIQICWANHVGCGWSLLAILRAAMRLSLRRVARLAGIDWPAAKSVLTNFYRMDRRPLRRVA
jgi:glycosyltransferase involved in cell wall biosynthesis